MILLQFITIKKAPAIIAKSFRAYILHKHFFLNGHIGIYQSYILSFCTIRILGSVFASDNLFALIPLF